MKYFRERLKQEIDRLQKEAGLDKETIMKKVVEAICLESGECGEKEQT